MSSFPIILINHPIISFHSPHSPMVCGFPRSISQSILHVVITPWSTELPTPYKHFSFPPFTHPIFFLIFISIFVVGLLIPISQCLMYIASCFDNSYSYILPCVSVFHFPFDNSHINNYVYAFITLFILVTCRLNCIYSFFFFCSVLGSSSFNLLMFSIKFSSTYFGTFV